MPLLAILNALTRVRQGRMSLCEPHFFKALLLANKGSWEQKR